MKIRIICAALVSVWHTYLPQNACWTSHLQTFSSQGENRRHLSI